MNSEIELKSRIITECEWIADLFIEQYSGKNGLVCEMVDSATGQILSQRAIVDELGDYIQNIIYLGQITNKNKYLDWSLKHIEAVAELCQTPSGLFHIKQDINSMSPCRNNLLPVYTIFNADTINGLVASYQLTLNPKILKISTRFFEGVTKYCITDNNVNYGAIPALNIKIPLASSLIAGYFGEELVNLYSITSESKYLELATNILETYMTSRYFDYFGLFKARSCLLAPLEIFLDFFYTVKGKPVISTAILVKDNVYLIHAFLAFYRATKDLRVRDLIKRWYESVNHKLIDEEGYCYNIWHPERGRSEIVSGLQHTHSFIEVLLDIYMDFNDEYALLLAKKIADLWLKHKSSKNLIRESKSALNKQALLDPQVDFAINLLKIWELTNIYEYKESAINIFRSIMNYHKLDYGYAWSTHFQTGNPLKSVIEVKMMGLLIKGYLVLHQVLDGKKIFQDVILKSISRDR